LLAPTLTASCSYQALFESIQQNHLQRCETTPIAQQAACEAHTKLPMKSTSESEKRCCRKMCLTEAFSFR
jgi:predicted neuraminidase